MTDIWNINPSHVDVDRDLISIPGREGFRGLIIDPQEKSAAQPFRSEWIVSRSDWKDLAEYLETSKTALPNYRFHWNNQNPESSCVYNAGEVVQNVMRNKQLGGEWGIKGAPMSGYCRVTRSRHSGSTMWGCLEKTQAGKLGNGFLPEKNPRNIALFGDYCVHQNSPFIYNNGREYFPDGWEEVAQWFTVVEWYSIDSYEEFVSAMLRGWGVCYGRSGHSIAGLQVVWYQGQACCKYMDSYGHGRGDNGFLIDTPRMMSTGGAWCCREVTLPPDITKPWEPCGEVSYAKQLTKEQFISLDGLGTAA